METLDTTAATLAETFQTAIHKPQLFLVFGGSQAQREMHVDLMVESYRMVRVSVEELVKEEQLKESPLANEIASILSEGKQLRKEVVARMVKKFIAVNGCKRYVISDFPERKEVFDELEHSIRDEVEMKKVIHIKSLEPLSRAEEDSDIENAELIKPKSFISCVEEFLTTGNVINLEEPCEGVDGIEALKRELRNHSVHRLPPVEVFFVSGGPGAGKGTQCSNLVKSYGFKHLSTGDLLRDAIKNGSKQGVAIDTCIKNGQLVSSGLLVDLIKSEISKTSHNSKYLIDGFPRNVENDQVWSEMMVNHAVVKGLIYMKCDEEVMQRRLLERAKTSGRPDDNIDIIKKRFKVFVSETQPIIAKYHKQNSVITIDALRSTEEVYQELRDKMEQRGVKPKGTVSERHPGVVLVLGGPGSGKGTQCENLVRTFGVKHLSTGDLLRDEQKHKGLNSDLIEDYIKEGRLVPSKILVRLIKKAMVKGGWNGIYLLDGFPRNLQNIEAWEEEMGDQVNILHTILFDCSEKVMEKRLLNRGKTSGRIDDNPETIKKRFATFEKETAPIIAKYSSSGSHIKVNAEEEIQMIFEDLKGRLIKSGFKTLE